MNEKSTSINAKIELQKRKDIAFFCLIDPRFRQYYDDEISSLYREYSSITASAHWLQPTEIIARQFGRWAFTTPADSIRSQ
jgi:hypothetical protein